MSPIILHHGLFGSGNFRGIAAAISELGHPVFISTVHPTAGIEKRARQLQEWMLGLAPQFSGLRAIVIAHSMGGLDVRFMLAHLGMAKHIEALVTIGTPHRGSPYGDWCAEHLGRRLRGFEIVRRLGLDVEGILDVTRERCIRFNEQTPDVPDVRYFSVSAASPWRDLPAFGIPSWYVVHRAEGDNDGLVSVSSAKWATHLGTWDADHWRAINQKYGRAALTAWDISPKYVELVRQVAGDSHHPPTTAGRL
jgi:triacylglycerol lipase